MNANALSDAALSCQNLSEFIGQDEIVRDIIPEIKASRIRGRAPVSMVFLGPPGLGKSTLATAMARDRGVNQIVLQGSRMPDQRPLDHIFRVHIDPRWPDDQRLDVTGIGQKWDPTSQSLKFTGNSQKPTQLLMEEWESVKRQINQNLQDVVQANESGMRYYQSPATPNRVWAPECWMVITSNYADALIRNAKALVDRCQVYYFRPYEVDVLVHILTQFARKCNLSISKEAATLLAGFSRGTPRQAKLLFHKACNVLIEYNYHCKVDSNEITVAMVEKSFENASMDHGGLALIEQRYMEILYRANDHTLPLTTLATMLGESNQIVERTIEPDLMQMGLVTRMSGMGRCLTQAGVLHMQKSQTGDSSEHIGHMSFAMS